MIRGLISLYRPKYLKVVVYMLQSTEYEIAPYLKWYWRTKDFSRVMNRRQLDKTRTARLLLLSVSIGVVLEILAGIILIVLGAADEIVGGVAFGIAVVVAYPIIWGHLITVPLAFGRAVVIEPRDRRLIDESKQIFADHKAIKIAVAGSYGKTTVKEILNTVLSEGKAVAVTPANKNVAASHAQFARTLTGEEEVLIIEYGEGRPGDVARFASYTEPTHAVITGLAPAHLNHYKTLTAAGEDIFSLADYLDGKNVYVNGDSPAVKPFLKKTYEVYGQSGALGWRVSGVKVSIDGLEFRIKKGDRAVKLKSRLLGRHQVGSLVLAAALALKLGLSENQVKKAVAKTVPFEHRMQPYQLSGAWIIDDTYNGNIEGIRAGTILLKELEAKRKIYVTPGLVDQGKDGAKIHRELGWLIAAARPDVVVLMKNSVTGFIQAGLMEGKFAGEVKIETEPLKFYSNLDQLVAAGDLVLMQNDWTDNYY